MMKIGFLPKWYIDQKNAKNIKTLKIVIIVIFLLNILFFNIILDRKNKIHDMNKSVQEQSSRLKMENKKISYNKDESLEVLKIVFDNIPREIKYKSITLEGKNVNLEIDSSEKDEYLKLIKYIEEREKFTITQVSTLKDNEDFRITMKLLN